MKVFKNVLKVTFLILLLAGIFASVALLALLGTTKLDIDRLKTDERKIEIYGMGDVPIGDRTPAIQSYDQIPKNLVNAFISIEDKRFFTHRGYDIKRMGGAMLSNIRSRNNGQGGSTITQQLIKNTHLTSDKTLTRKIKELKLAADLEKQMSKEQIITMYLNKIYFGNGIYGAAGAAKFYFDKPLQDLNLPECAYLAGLVKAPSRYSSDLKLATGRQRLVLSEMNKDGFITLDEKNFAADSPLQFVNSKSGNGFIRSNVVRETCMILGFNENELLSSGYKVYTDLREDLIAQSAMCYKNLPCDMINLVIDSTTHSIVLVNSTKNIILDQILRQPGSVIKPIIPYALALEEKIISPATKILDEPCAFGDYSPKNFNDVYRGYVSVRDAIKYSSNIVAVKTLEYCGVEKAFAFAKSLDLGLNEKDKSLALALGGLTYGLNPRTLADLYAAFAEGGYLTKSHLITRITDQHGNTVYQKSHQARQIVSQDTAYLVTDMLKSAATDGTAKALSALSFDVAAKTGTAGNTDAWTIASTCDYTVLTWCGSLSGERLPEGVTGGTLPCKITRDILSRLHDSSPPTPFKRPKTIQAIPLDKYEYDFNNQVVAAGAFSGDIVYELFSSSNLPKTAEFIIPAPLVEINVDRLGFTNITLICCNKFSYDIYKKIGGERIDLKSIQNYRGTIRLKDIAAQYDFTDYYIDVGCGGQKKTFPIGKVKID